MAINPIPDTYRVYSIHDVLAVCENEDFTEHFHGKLCNSDYSYGNNGDTLIVATDFASFFYQFCEDNAEVFADGSINKRAINALIERMIKEHGETLTFVGLGC